MSDAHLDSVFSDDLPPDHRSGVVAVVGRPNAGKSTLINRFLGQKVAIVSPKPQTTRRRQLGILTTDNAQILFIDTPGLHLPQHKLGEYMVRAAESAFRDVDQILLIVDVYDKPDVGDQRLAETVARLRGSAAVRLALNKIDRLDDLHRAERLAAFTALMPHERAYPISALNGDGVDALLNDLIAVLPLGPRYYPADDVSDMNMRFVAAEVVREKIMTNTDHEIPYSVAVEVETYREEGALTRISAIIYVERDTQKRIVIGKGGALIKQIGTQARLELEALLEGKVFLELRVKTLPNWRSDETLMRRLGYPMDDER